MNSDPQRLALFGGTFDPVHHGHLDLVARAREVAKLDRVIFLPCARSPFKDVGPAAAPEARLKMLQLALDERGWGSWASVSRFELDRPPPSFSWQTTAHFRETEPPDTELFWILGADQWAAIESWAESEKLREWLHFLVVTRQGTNVQERVGWRFTILNFDHPASATAIRSGHGDPAWLPNTVRGYLEEHPIYRD